MLRAPICLAVLLVLAVGVAGALADPVPIGVGGLPRMGNEEDAKTAKELGLNLLTRRPAGTSPGRATTSGRTSLPRKTPLPYASRN